MKKLLNSSKWIYYTLGIISGLIVVCALFFMNQYRYLRINYNIKNGSYNYVETAKLNGADQTNLFDFVNKIALRVYDDETSEEYSPETQKFIDENEVLKTLFEKNSDNTFKNLENKGTGLATKWQLKSTIFDDLVSFRGLLDSYNNLILWYGVVSLICLGLLLFLANHSRKIYYKANLYGGIAIPLVNVIFAIVLIVMAIVLLGYLNDPVNNAAYNVVSSLQNPKNIPNGVYRVVVYYTDETYTTYDAAKTDAANMEYIQSIVKGFNINPATLIAYIAIFSLTAAYNVFLMIFAVLKYKATEKERNDTLEKARLAGERV